MVVDFSEPSMLITFVLTIAIIVVKFSLTIYLAGIWSKQDKSIGTSRYNFIFALMCFTLCLGIGRTLFCIFDFFLTDFIPANFVLMPNIILWQLGCFFAGTGGAIVLLVLDRQIFQFKFKGILALISFSVAVIQLVYPINGSLENFELVSSIGFIGTAMGILIPLTFFYMAIKGTGELRRTSLILAFSIIIYAVIGMLMSENLLATMENMRLFIIIMVPIVKIVCLIILGKTATKLQI